MRRVEMARRRLESKTAKVDIMLTPFTERIFQRKRRAAMVLALIAYTLTKPIGTRRERVHDQQAFEEADIQGKSNS